MRSRCDAPATATTRRVKADHPPSRPRCGDGEHRGTGAERGRDHRARLELDPAETQAALQERRFRERVVADIEGGRRAGVNATPTFFVDGERLDRPWRELPQIVRASLASG
jgi:hypothetical protein